jgi:hypothetical protein
VAAVLVVHLEVMLPAVLAVTLFFQLTLPLVVVLAAAPQIFLVALVVQAAALCVVPLVLVEQETPHLHHHLKVTMVLLVMQPEEITAVVVAAVRAQLVVLG